MLTLYRWTVTGNGGNEFRIKERLINTALAPAVTDPRIQDLITDYYVSKQGGPLAWLTCFAPADRERDLQDLVGSHLPTVDLHDFCVSNTDVLLQSAYDWWRAATTRMSDVALALHEADLVQHQERLIHIGCKPQTTHRSELELYLLANSPPYAALSPDERDQFWQDFDRQTSDPSTISSPGHWLWNIVLGCDWFVGESPSRIASVIDINLLH